MLLSQGAGDVQAGQAPAGDLVVDVTTQNFMKEVIEESKRRPVLVDFWAPWCGPCKTLGPVIEKVVSASKGKVKLAKMNIDEHPAVAQQLGIQSIPAVFAFSNGQPVDGFVGALPEAEVKAFIERLAGPAGVNINELLKTGEAALGANDADGAIASFSQVLHEDEKNIPAHAGLVRALVASGDVEAAKQSFATIPADKASDAAVSAAKAALDLADQAKNVGDVAPLEAKVAANPADHQARFDLAVALAAHGNRAEAVQNLIDIVKRDRKWNDDGARKQLVQFFEAWGPADENTTEGRRQLSSILFA
jgi:putative thioredoxin